MRSIALLFKVLWSPGEAMFLLSKNPRVLAPILFLSLMSLIAAVAINSKVRFGELYMTMLNRSPQAAQMPEEAKQRIQGVMMSPAVQGAYVASAVVLPALLVLFIAAIYFGLFSMLGREGPFKAFFSITAFSFVPTVFGQLAGVARVFVIPPSALMLDELGSLSPAVFLERDSVSPVLFAAANMMDLVSIWILILMIIGYGFVTPKSLSKTTRAITVLSLFVIYQAIRLGFVALRGA